jgi:putative effector of murein hydrolase
MYTRAQIFKVFLTVAIGFVYSLFTTAWGVQLVQRLTGNAASTTTTTTTSSPKKVVATAAAAGPPSKPFTEQEAGASLVASVAAGALSVAATRSDHPYATPLRTACLFLWTVTSYIWAARLPKQFCQAVHPLITASTVLLGAVRLLGVATNVDYLDILRAYRVGTLDPLEMGAGDILMYLLRPSVVAFAVAVYGRRKPLFANLLPVMTAMVVSSAGGLFGTAAFVRLIAIGGKGGGRIVRLSVLGRNVTTALSLALTAVLEGDLSIAAAAVCVTGVLGGMYGRPLLDAAGITDPLVRGLSIGSSSQGVGIAGLLPNEPDAFAFGAIAMTLTGLSATTLVSIPPVREALIKLATGPTVVEAAASAV